MNTFHSRWRISTSRRGFTLIEVLLVLSILSLLATLLFPALVTARGKARSMACASNLRQIGIGILLYAQDNDDFYPRAVDPTDRAFPFQWGHIPEFEAAIPQIGLLHVVMRPYLQSAQVWACPSDDGFASPDFISVPLDAFPSSFQKYGTSYYFRTEIAAKHAAIANIAEPAAINVLFDSVGTWHGTFSGQKRYNILFADNHVKNVSFDQVMQAWGTPLFNR